MPLWSCARMPTWLKPSMSDEQDKSRLVRVFRQTFTTIDGKDSLFLRLLDERTTKHALMDVCEYDAVKDGWLLGPALESM